jgi:hypothetical protein
MRRSLGAVVVIGLLTVVGCGGSSGGSDEDQIRELFSTFAEDFRNDDYGNACEAFSDEAVDEMIAESDSDDADCEGLMLLAGSFASDEDLEGIEEFTDLTIDGDTAVAITENGDGEEEESNLVKVDGEWKFGPDGDDSSSTDSSEDALETSDAEPPSLSEAKAAVEDTIPEVKSNIRDIGADLIGTPSVQCAATGGPETECKMEIPFRRLDECAIATANVLFITGEDGIETTEDSGDIDSRSQVCYIGDNGEPVPELP